MCWRLTHNIPSQINKYPNTYFALKQIKNFVLLLLLFCFVLFCFDFVCWVVCLFVCLLVFFFWTRSGILIWLISSFGIIQTLILLHKSSLNLEDSLLVHESNFWQTIYQLQTLYHLSCKLLYNFLSKISKRKGEGMVKL